ncbi:ribbon-helix-helix protein, CopG family [Escherichia coli]|nr:ribbon-helix-helix protein, CopG family [Escherichia coli]
MSTRVMTAHIPTELAEKVDEYAQRMDRPRGWIVKQALADWVALEEERYQMTLEALADVDAGRTIDDATFQAWLNKLEREIPSQ